MVSKRQEVICPGFKRKRVSIIGALNEGKIKASWVIEGYCNSEIFEDNMGMFKKVCQTEK